MVDQKAWRDHAEKWRHSIDIGHATPDGPGTPPRYADGTLFKPIDALIEAEWDKINAWLKKHFGVSLPGSPPTGWTSPGA